MNVLIVDDDQDMLNILSLLMKINGHEPITATGGFDGISAAQSLLPDIILLDIMMPDLDGFEVLSEIRSNPSTKTIPVVFVTALDTPECKEKALLLGANGYVTKPYRRNHLMRVIREVTFAGVGGGSRFA